MPANYVAIERSRYPLTFRQAIALSILITVVAVCAIGDAEAGGKTWLWAATALVTLALIVLVARNLRARRAYRRKALSPARSTKSASGQLVAVYDIDPSGDVSAGLTVPFGEVLSKSAHRARRTFAELTGVDARFAANLTAASYATAEAFNDDLRLFRTDACEQPCTYIAWPAPRVVICESAAHEQLVEMSDALTAALTYGLWGSGWECVPVWLLIGLAHRCAVKGRRRIMAAESVRACLRQGTRAARPGHVQRVGAGPVGAVSPHGRSGAARLPRAI